MSQALNQMLDHFGIIGQNSDNVYGNRKYKVLKANSDIEKVFGADK